MIAFHIAINLLIISSTTQQKTEVGGGAEAVAEGAFAVPDAGAILANPSKIYIMGNLRVVIWYDFSVFFIIEYSKERWISCDFSAKLKDLTV